MSDAECSRCEVCSKPAPPGYDWCSKRCYDVLYARKRRLVGKASEHPHNERNPTYRGVIALDGEGIDGRYTLLATSDGEYIEDYEQGLSTIECFEFLLSLPAKPLKWGFAFSYDVNMILRDLSYSHLKLLQKNSRVYWRQYSITHFVGKMFRIINRWTSESVQIWDLYPFIQSSFVRFLDKFDLASTEEIDRIAAMKDRRSDFSEEDPDDIRQYCISECTYLAKGVMHFLQLFEDMEYRTNVYYSPGSIASIELRKRAVLSAYEEPPSWIQEFVELAYYGGRAEASRIGPVLGEFWQYDINSAYPYAATLLPCFACGEWERSKEVVPHGVYKVQWETDDETIWGPFPWRPHSGSLKYPTSGVSYVWGIELLPWLGEFPIQVRDGYVWHQSCTHQPFRYLNELYDQRLSLKADNDPREYVLKLILNSTYGKLAQRRMTVDGKKPRYQALCWAGLITATTRAMLGASLRNHQGHVLMVATDSILSDRPLSELVMSERLGDWSETRLSDLFVVGAGFLFAGSGSERHVRTRGIRSQDVQYKYLEDAWRIYGKTGTYPVTINRFFGYGISLQRKEGYSLWRKFHSLQLEKRFEQFPRRRWMTENQWDGRTLAPTLLDAQGADLLDGFVDLLRDAEQATDDPSLARLLVSLASHRSMDEPSEQPDWVIERMGGE